MTTSGAQAQIPPLGDQDLCIEGLTLSSTVADVDSTWKTHGRKAAGYDYDNGYQSIEVYLDPDGNHAEIVKGTVDKLCSYAQRIQLSTAGTATPDAILKAFGEPYKKAFDRMDYWFYFDRSGTQVLVFGFPKGDRAIAWVVDKQQAVQQWYPLLGDVSGPKPIAIEDAGVGQFLVRMNADSARSILKGAYSEGRLPPYDKLIASKRGLELHHDMLVEAVYADGVATESTARGIRIGSSATDVRAAYGPAREFWNTHGDCLWAYNNLRLGVSLVFTVKDGKVSAITAFDTDYYIHVPRVPWPPKGPASTTGP